MKAAFLLPMALAGVLLAQPANDKARVSLGSVVGMEQSMDGQFAAFSRQDPIEVVAVTQGAYIRGYGVVLLSEINLAPAPGITPFHQTVTKDEIARCRQKNVDRLPKLRQLMQEMLLSSAASLDSVPASEQIAIAVTLFHWHWEDTNGLPSQIVMRGPKGSLVEVKVGHKDRSTLPSVITAEEF